MAPSLSRRCWLAGAALAVLPAAARAGFNFFTGEFLLTHQELQALVSGRFPLQQRFMEMFTVALREPRVGLNARANRLAITATLAVDSPFLRPGIGEGTVGMSSSLRWDGTARALRLEQPAVERLELPGLPRDANEPLRQVCAVAAPQLLQGQILRSFTKEEMTFGLKTYEVGDITVQDDGLKVQLR